MRVADDVDGLRQVDDHDALAGGQQVERRTGHRASGPSRRAPRMAVGELVPVRRQEPPVGAGLHQPGRRAPVDVGDQLHQDLGAEQLHGVRDGNAGRPEPTQEGRTRRRPTCRPRPAGPRRCPSRRRAGPGSCGSGGPRGSRRRGGRAGARRVGSAWRPSRPSARGGTARSSRKTSASLPVLRMPSSVSMAPSAVMTQSGQGFGPRAAMSNSPQVDQRWPGRGRRELRRSRTGRKRTDLEVDMRGMAPGSSEGGRAEHADVAGHVTPPSLPGDRFDHRPCATVPTNP